MGMDFSNPEERKAKIERFTKRREIETELRKPDRCITLEGNARDVLTVAEFSKEQAAVLANPSGRCIKTFVSWEGKTVSAYWLAKPGPDRLMSDALFQKVRSDLFVILSRRIVDGKEGVANAAGSEEGSPV